MWVTWVKLFISAIPLLVIVRVVNLWDSDEGNYGVVVDLWDSCWKTLL